MTDRDTIEDLLSAGAEDAVAIAAPDRASLTYGGLRAHLDEVRTALNGMGLGRNDRVAIVLDNGPEMASAFVAVGAAATTAPLNPAYREDEFRFYLSDLGAKALIAAAGSASPAVAVAESLGMTVIRLVVDEGMEAGRFRLEGPASAATETGAAGPDDIALILHTSGTTSRPKIVPLSQRNVCRSAANIARSLALTADDRCLNVMPLFHIHGLIAATLASLSAGAALICTPGFNALRFFAWMETCRPTWYTAVPTMHHAILSRAERNKAIIESNPLRFIRSSSASLPPSVMAELEATFGCPVVEAYGMTEAAHQMASNPLPPRTRKPGTVGIAAGPEVGVMDEAGNLLKATAAGEVVIRGPNVTAGYENNPEANASAFVGGWFRTGDQGVMDEEGYLTITGRLKEIINRGGEKVSPREVDEAMLEHPAVAQAVAFAIPHQKLGEEVGAVVVLREGAEATEREIRDFVARKLADFKVPRRVMFVDEIPKGATGKLQRIGLAEKLGISA